MLRKKVPQEILELRQILGFEFDYIVDKAGVIISFEAEARELVRGVLDDIIARLPQLQRLVLRQCAIVDIKPLAKLSKLTGLYLRGNSISDLSPLIGLSDLTSLNLDSNSISDIKPLAGLSNLTSLNLDSNSISDIKPLAGLSNLASLYLSNNSISDIKPLARLSKLIGLDLGVNSISNIKPLAGLSNLTNLYLPGNSISDLSPLAGLSNLTDLYLSDNSISDVSPLAGLSNLADLYLDSNSVSDVSPLAGLSNLADLNLDSNSISDVKPLARLSNLNYLDLDSNSISDIKPLAGLSNLTDISLYATPLAEHLPAEILDAGWPAIRDYLLSQHEKDAFTPLREVKLLLLGNTNVGKSNLLESLQTGQAPQGNDSTHGLEYAVLPNLVPSARVHCWDFGGQEFYHATHQLFFSPGALHVVLWCQTDTPRHPGVVEATFEVDYWLRCVEQLSQETASIKRIETLVVENKIDKQEYLPAVADQKRVSARFGSLGLRFAAVSLREQYGLGGLRELLCARAEALFQEYPVRYLNLLEQVQAGGEAVVPLARLVGEEKEEYVRTAMGVFHRVGCLLYFPDVIPDKVFAQPKALLDLLYERILSRKRQAKLTQAQLKKAVADNSLGLSPEEVGALLRHFHLVFQIPAEDDTLYVPQYLPAEPAWLPLFMHTHFRQALVRIEADSFLMNLVLLRLYTRYAEYALKDQPDAPPLFWRDGILIRKDDRLLLVRFNRAGQALELFTDSSQDSRALQDEVIRFVVQQPLTESGSELVKDVEHVMLQDDIPHDERGAVQRLRPAGHGGFRLRKRDLALWESDYFRIRISNDGRYFVDWRELVEHADRGIYSLEARDPLTEETRIVSVFDFNKYLPAKDRGRMKKLFISYSKDDLELVNTFINHLSALKRDGRIATWYCTELTVGSDWNADIQRHFDDADIACFMVSPNFMKTDYIHEYEIDKAIRRKQNDPAFKIVPIILDFCRWRTKHNNLGDYTALPYTAKPVVDFKNPNKAWYVITECLRLLIDEDLNPKEDDFFAAREALPKDVQEIFRQITKHEA